MTPYFESENGKLYCGDCLEVLKGLPDIPDLVVTDPPYEMCAKGGGIGNKRQYMHGIISSNLENGFNLSLLDNFKNWFCFCSKEQLVEIIKKAEKRNWMILTWNKTNPTPLTNNNYLPDTEYIIHSYEKGRLFGEYKDKSRYYIHPIWKNNYNHPTVKPSFIMSKLIRLGSIENELILDPFLGSGTTAVVCEQLNRKWIGIEISEKYCEIAAKRIQHETQQMKLFK